MVDHSNRQMFFHVSGPKAERSRAPDIIAVQELFASPFVPFCCAQSFAVRIMASLGYNAVIGPNPTILDLVRRGKWMLACD